MAGRGRRLRGLAREIAARSLRRIYAEAVELARRGDYETARLLVGEAEEVRRAARLRRPRYLRRGVCRNCGVPLVPGVTAVYRLRRDGRVTRLVVTCLVCGYKHRYILRVRRGRRRGAGVDGDSSRPAGFEEAS